MASGIERQDDSSWKENALKVAKVKECDCLVELEGAKQTIETLTKEASKKEETLKFNTIKGNSNHPNARVNKTKGSPPYFPYNCYFCHTRGHKIAHCAKFIEVCKKKQSMPMGKPKRIRQVWVRKDKLDQVKEAIFDEKKTLDMKECPKLLGMNGGSTSGVNPPSIV